MPRRVNTVRPLCKNPGASAQLEAESLADKIDFALISSSVLWCDILDHVNVASKALQSVKLNIQLVLLSLESVLAFLLECKENGCERVIDEAMKVCQLTRQFN